MTKNQTTAWTVGMHGFTQQMVNMAETVSVSKIKVDSCFIYTFNDESRLSLDTVSGIVKIEDEKGQKLQPECVIG